MLKATEVVLDFSKEKKEVHSRGLQKDECNRRPLRKGDAALLYAEQRRKGFGGRVFRSFAGGRRGL